MMGSVKHVIYVQLCLISFTCIQLLAIGIARLIFAFSLSFTELVYNKMTTQDDEQLPAAEPKVRILVLLENVSAGRYCSQDFVLMRLF